MPDDQEHPAPSWLSRWAWLLLVIYWPLLFYLTHAPRLKVESVPSTPGLDKVQHCIVFGILGLLITFAANKRDRAISRSAIVIGWVVGCLYGIIDEYTQRGIDGRSPEIMDAMANFVGVTTPGLYMLRDRWWPTVAGNAHWIARVLLVVLLPLTLYATFKKDFRWQDYYDFNAYFHDNGWPRGRWPYPPIDKIAHTVAAMLMVWLLPMARLLGRRYLPIKNAAIVLLITFSAYVVEWLQKDTGRAKHPFDSESDINFHFWGVGAGLVGWALFAAIRRPQDEAGGEGQSDEQRDQRFIGHAMIVSFLTLLSRGLGLVREAVMGAVFDISPVLSAFDIGFMVPNLFRRLFGEGALTAAFIPAYAEQLKKDPKLARKMATLCLGVLFVVTGAITFAGSAALKWTIDTQTLSDDTELALKLTRYMLPYMPMVCIVALMGGILQVHRRFGPPAAAPIILNIVMILGVTHASSGFNYPFDPQRGIEIVAGSVLSAGLIQLLWMLAALLDVQRPMDKFWQAARAMRPVLVMMLPMVLGLAVFQLNTLLDQMIAFGLAPPTGGGETFEIFGQTLPYPIADRGSTAALTRAQRLYQFPLGVFGVALATAIFPALASSAAEREAIATAQADRYQTILQHGLRLTMFIGLPASIGLVLVRLPLTRVIFENGKMDIDDSLRIATLLAGYGSAVWAYSMTHTVTRAFYAVKDARTPLVVSIVMVFFNFALNLALIWTPLREAGLAWSTAITASIQVAILSLLLRRYAADPVDRTVRASWGRTLLLTIIMAVAIAPPLLIFDPAELSRLQSGALLAVMVALGAAVFFTGARMFKCEELRWLRKRSTE